MSYEFYKTIHYVSLMSLLISLIFAIYVHTKNGHFKDKKKFIYALHGISWIVLFFSANGLVVTTGISENFPAWAMTKTGIWIALGLLPFLFKRLPRFAFANCMLVIGLIIGAIYLAVYKPF